MLVPKEISGTKNMATVKTIRIILDLKFKVWPVILAQYLISEF